MFFFFEPKTADEWRISDWSSDVCSSDLITDISAVVDIFPEARSVTISGSYRMQNRTSKPISDLHVTINPDLDDIRFDFPAHTLVESDPVSGYRIYRPDTPLAPGAAMDLEFGYTSRPHGFPLNGGDPAEVYNGTFFKHFTAPPQLCYDARPQLPTRNDRHT